MFNIFKNKNNAVAKGADVQSDPAVANPPLDVVEAQNYMRILLDSKKLMESTLNPATFFGRLGTALDIMLILGEKAKSEMELTNELPALNEAELLQEIEMQVGRFIDRYWRTEVEQASSLKTDSAIAKRKTIRAGELKLALEQSSSYWNGYPNLSHYTGPLYTYKNWEAVQAIVEGSN